MSDNSYDQYLRTQLRIARRLSAAPRPAQTNLLPVPTRGSVPLSHLVRGYLFPPVETASVAEAETAIREITAILKRKGVVLHGARWLGGREYYHWLRNVFLQVPVPATTNPERPVEFHFTDLVPAGVDNIFRTVDRFLRQLARGEGLPNKWWLMAMDTPAGELSPAQERYLTAWQAAFLTTTIGELRPVAVHDLATGGVQLDFAIRLDATLEDRSTTTFRGTGRAWLIYAGAEWRLTGLVFPGFRLPV